MKREVIVLGVVLGILGLGGRALAGTPPQGAAAGPLHTPAQAKAAPDDLVRLLESKGILSDTEAALASETQLQPQTKQLLAELLLSKHLITEKEYDRTIEACSSAAGQTTPTATPGSGEAAGTEAAGSGFNGSGEGRFGGFKSFSAWIGSLLPGGEGNNYIDFGTIEPEPPGGEKAQGESGQPRAKSERRRSERHRKDAAQTAPAPDAKAPRQ
jgi:hypothetical protein